MARKPTGGIVAREGKNGMTYQLRFTAEGRRQYVTLGSSADGWTREKAQAELRHTLSDVERGIWKPPEPEPAPAVEQDPTFHDFASDWFDAREAEWRPKTREDYLWALSDHLLPFFKNHRLSQITEREVDRYKTSKLKQGALSAGSINKTLVRLAQVLQLAVDYKLITENPARGRNRRLKENRAAPVWLDSAEHITALLDAAEGRDRALIATLVFSGVRIGELTELRWRDVNLADGWITVPSAKTAAGARRIDLLPALRDELATYRADTKPSSSNVLVFGTQAGGPMNPSNIRNRILAPAIAIANQRLEEQGATPLPERLSPHKLRHTYASLLVALGVDPGAVMDQLGHEDAAFTLSVYRHGMRRDEAAKQALRELVCGASSRVDEPHRSRFPAGD